ncbi:MAG: repeat protein, partial [Armatimonadetes bacterium]|nr:repeat protein [Armatimonadota bacterium]
MRPIRTGGVNRTTMHDILCPTCGLRNRSGVRACVSCGTPLSATTAPSHVLPPGTKLRGGDYTVGKLLGQGGFGITYLGSDVGLTRPVAVKELFPYGSIRSGKEVHPAADWTEAAFREAKQKFGDEARVLARFHHPAIVRVYTVFEENATSYMVMEYLRGKSLGGMLDERGGPLEETSALTHVRRVSDALAVVHGAGLLHRDIKPDNVMVTDTGRTVLLDFGTAREYAAGHTRRMTAMLTPGYAPLEQYSQQARFGTFTDVYALAAMLYHLLTGQLPVAALDRIQGVELPTVRSLNPAISAEAERAVLQGMQMEVGKRPQTVQEFLALLPGGSAQSTVAPEARPAEATASRPGPAQSPARPVSVPLPFPPSPASVGPASAESPRPREAERPRPLPKPVLHSTLTGHTKWVNSLAYSPDGSFLVSGSHDNTVVLWDLRSNAGQRLTGHGGPMLGALGAIFAVAFDPDGQTLCSGGNDDTVRFWNVADGRLRRTYETTGGNVNALAYSPNGEMLAIGGQYQRTELWDPHRERSVGVLGGHMYSVVAVAFSPDGELLATGGEDGMALLWRLPEGKAISSLTQHQGAVR